MKKQLKILSGVMLAVSLTGTAMAGLSLVTIPYSFTNNTKAESGQVNANFTAVATGTNAALGAINTAAGTKSSLNARLSVALNADGTFRNVSGVTASSQWVNPGLLQTYSSANKFYVDGADHTDIYITYRRLKAILGASTVYSEVASSAYTGGKTIVTLADAVLNNTLDTVEHSIFSPAGSADSAISAASATGYNTATANTASTIVRRNAFGNFSAGQITATTFKGALTGTATTATNSGGTGNIPYDRYENGLRIIRGIATQAATGSISKGSGLAVVDKPDGTGSIRIAWTDAFSDTPTVIVTPNTDGNRCYLKAGYLNNATVIVSCVNSSGSAADTAFTILAIGPN